MWYPVVVPYRIKKCAIKKTAMNLKNRGFPFSNNEIGYIPGFIFQHPFENCDAFLCFSCFGGISSTTLMCTNNICQLMEEISLTFSTGAVAPVGVDLGMQSIKF